MKGFFDLLRKPAPFELHLGGLFFLDADLEREFKEQNRKSMLFQARLAILLGFFMYPAFLALDYWLIPRDFHVALAIRLGVTLLIMLPGLIVSFFETRALRWVEVLTVVAIGGAQAGHIGLMLFTEAPPYYGWGITAIILVFMYTFSRIRFTTTLWLGVLFLVSFELVIALSSRHGFIDRLAANFFLLSINFAAALAGYVIEYQVRSNFIQRKLTDQALAEVERARADSDLLLERILPVAVARELKERGEVEPLFFESVTVLFTDFVGFTQASERMLPDELVAELDACFSQFDAVAARNGIEKLKTIGDAYMCASGLPQLSATHAVDACLAALEFRAFMLQTHGLRNSVGEEFFQIRIGIHTGPVTAGVIGINKFAYDIWGDTVNTASRMESSGEPGRVNISGDTYELVKNFFECEYRGKVKAKGKGEVDMYFLERIKTELSADVEGLMPNGRFELMRAEAGSPYAI
ncbi:MAG: adenylate/guanylate cyclase domain-containing protein [Leptospirales bacterium]|nr:adenylate/guanylate cyclase domain-containing protein [Leptospirales bacterium]